jgi:hypothetical protein
MGKQSDVFLRHNQRSKIILAARAVLGLLIVAAAIGATAFLSRKNEAGRVLVDSFASAGDLETGALVRVESDCFVDSDLYIGKNAEKPESIIYFVPLYDGGGDLAQILPVESAMNYLEDAALPGGERPMRTFDGTVKYNAANWTACYNALLDFDGMDEARAQRLLADVYVTKGGKGVGHWVLAIPGAILFGVSVSSLLRRKKIKARMDAFGIGEYELEQFGREYENGRTRLGVLDITDSWLFSRIASDTMLLPLSAVVWLHNTVTRHTTNGIPTGRTYSVSVYFRDGGKTVVNCKKSTADTVLETIARRCPNAAVGFSKEREAAFARGQKPE